MNKQLSGSVHRNMGNSFSSSVLMCLLLCVVILLSSVNFLHVYSADQAGIANSIKATADSVIKVTEAYYERYDALFRGLALTDPFAKQQSQAANDLSVMLLRNNPDMINVAATDREGIFFASAIPVSKPGDSIKKLDFFQRVAGGAERVVMNPHNGPLSKDLVTGLVVPLRDTQGRFNGLLGASIRLSSLTDQWQAVLDVKAGEDIVAWDEQMVIQYASPSLKQYIGEPLAALNELYAAISAGSSRTGKTYVSGQKQYYFITVHSDISNLNMAILAPYDIPLALFATEHPQIGVLITVILVLFFVSLVVYRRERAWKKSLLASEEQYQNVLDAIPAILVGVDEYSRVTHWNNAAVLQTGLSGLAVMGKTLSSVLDRPLAATLVQETLKTRQASERRKTETVTDSGTRYESLRCYPINTGESCGALLRIDDVTEQVRFNEILIQTEKMMSVGGLAAGMAHEINNPLGIIMQSTQNIFRRIAPDMKANRNTADEVGADLHSMNLYLESRGVLGFITNISDAANRAARIVSNMLEFSRRSGDERDFHDINALLDSTLTLAQGEYSMRKKYDFKRVRIEKRYASDLPLVPCSPTEIEQVILNLLKNAAQAIVEHSPEGYLPVITLTTRPEQDYVQIEISDNGPGMDESVRRRIFEPFYSTKPAGEGTGLGLSVSYFIVTQNHGGTFHVESEPGKGATFVIRLPIIPPP